MSDVKALAEERTQMLVDVLAGRIPKRVPVCPTITYEYAVEYTGNSLFEAFWHMENFEKISDVICRDFYVDLFPMNYLRFPALYKTLGARNWVQGSNGFMQHPEVVGLLEEEYDEFIESPYDCIMEKVLPRIYTNLNTDPVTRSIVLAKAFKIFNDEFGNIGAVTAKLSAKYGLANVNLFSAAPSAPFDFVADQLRGFRNIMLDIRRIPEKVEAAVKAAAPLMTKMGLPAGPTPPNTAVFIPMHMGPFMRTADFERFYYPTFKEMVENFVKAGLHVLLFVEQDMMRYLDHLNDLPENTIMWFELGDPKLAKEKVGKKHIITGFYPVTMLKTGTVEQCVDKAKEILDILAPGGRYFFNFDKAPLTFDTAKPENLKAVLEYVAQNANY
ncbi:MAG: uroporphyrinogen decarboxylase [Firmicutes bacterium]|nr:uroporphyrinogen decarboxylase [Bacillota bacterium]